MKKEFLRKREDYPANKLTREKVLPYNLLEQGIETDILNLIKKIRKQTIKGRIKQAKKTYKQAYCLYSKLPIEEQASILPRLIKVQDQITLYIFKKSMERGFLKKIKYYFSDKLTKKKTLPYNTLERGVENDILNLIKEVQKQITKGNISEAKKTYQQAYGLYSKLPIEEQVSILPCLTRVQSRIDNIEERTKRLELKELTQHLSGLKSERETTLMFNKSNIHKRLDFLTKYTQKVGKQGFHGLEAGKIHLKEKLKELAESAEKIEEKEKRKLTPEEKSFLTKIKEIRTFSIKKGGALEEAFKQKQKQKQLFTQLYDLTQQIKVGLHPETKKKIVKVPQHIMEPPTKTIKPAPKPELKPPAPPLPKEYIEKKETKILEEIEKLLLYLKKRKEEGVYKLKPKGKEFLDKIEAMVETIKESEKKRVLKNYEKEFINSLFLLMRKKEEKIIRPTEEEKRMLEFLEHMKEKEMIHAEEQKSRKEKKRLETKPLIETPKVKMSIERLKRLAKEEEKIMHKLQKIPKKYPIPLHRTQRKRLEEHTSEITAEETKKRKTKEMLNLVKEEEKVLSKLNELEKGFNA